MLFNSLEFALFFPLVYLAYLALSWKWQNRMLLLASYVFYGWWDWRFLALLWISTIVDHFCGLRIAGATDGRSRRRYLVLSMATNLGLLGFFKYWNFFLESAQQTLRSLGADPGAFHLEVVLPVGISFYTFQTMTYTIDVYRRQVEPTRRFFDFALFVAFFPQLVAGPIERARTLLPQVLAPRRLAPGQISEGVYLVGWGLFKKVFIADNLAIVVEATFADPTGRTGVEIWIALYAFAFQIYCDFSGYTDIARGLAKLMGFDLLVNFRLPYFATNPADFWRRWHISLSTWLRDYLYIPLGGNRQSPLRTHRNLFLTMLLGGLWHGAAWTFVLWGAYHGLLLMAHRVVRRRREARRRARPPLSPWGVPLGRVAAIAFTFHLVCIGWLLFRAPSLEQAVAMAGALFGDLTFTTRAGLDALGVLFFVGPLLVMQAFQYRTGDLSCFLRWQPTRRVAFVLACGFLMFYVVLLGREAGIGGGNEFIYFQF